MHLTILNSVKHGSHVVRDGVKKWAIQKAKSFERRTSRWRLGIGWVRFRTLSFEYIMDGHRVHFERMQRRLAQSFKLTEEESEFKYVFVFGMHTSKMMERTNNCNDEVDYSPYAMELEHCKELMDLFIRHGFDPYRKRECFGGRSIFEWYFSDRENKFYIHVLNMFEANEARKRGAHLDEVLPLVDALEDAPAQKRARL